MTKHYALFALICLSALVGLALLGPLPQDPLYHQFADQRPLLGIANFLDVISNLPFVIIGLLGLGYLAPGCLRRGRPAGGLPPLLLHYRIFFVGVLLTGFGSGYYHLAPDNHTLVWDRLPMTIAFMAFFAALVGESLSLRAGRLLLWPLLALGLASVVFWHWTEELGRGDLRPYVLVQFLPILLTPYLLLVFPSALAPKRHLWWLVACYLLAKLLELTDHFWFELSGIVSGHSLKHLAAAWACYWFYVALRRRRPMV